MSGLFDQIKSIFIDDEEGYGDGDWTPDGIETEPVEDVAPKKLGVVRPINSRSYEVMVISPKSFDEALGITKNLIEKKTIVLNLELLGHEDSQRIVDFLSGAACAIDGKQQKIGDGVFIFTPNNVNISTEPEKKVATSITDAIWNGIQVK